MTDIPNFRNLRRPATTTQPEGQEAPAAVVPPRPAGAPPKDPIVQFTTRTDEALRDLLGHAAISQKTTVEALSTELLIRGMSQPLNRRAAEPVVLDQRAEAYMSLIRTNERAQATDPGALGEEARIDNVVTLSFKMRASLRKDIKDAAKRERVSVQDYVNILLRRGLRAP